MPPTFKEVLTFSSQLF